MKSFQECCDLICTYDIVYVFPQSWPDTSMGHSRTGDIVGRAFTTSLVFVVFSIDCRRANVFSNGKHLYTAIAGDRFMQDIANQDMASYEERHRYEISKDIV